MISSFPHRSFAYLLACCIMIHWHISWQDRLSLISCNRWLKQQTLNFSLYCGLKVQDVSWLVSSEDDGFSRVWTWPFLCLFGEECGYPWSLVLSSLWFKWTYTNFCIVFTYDVPFYNFKLSHPVTMCTHISINDYLVVVAQQKSTQYKARSWVSREKWN